MTCAATVATKRKSNVRAAPPDTGFDTGVAGGEPPAWVQLLLDRQDRIERELVALRRAIQQQQGPRDEAERAVLPAIAQAVGDATFTSAELLEHARACEHLRAALLAADVASDDGQGVGFLLRRLARITDGELAIERTDERRGIAVWRVLVRDLRG